MNDCSVDDQVITSKKQLIFVTPLLKNQFNYSVSVSTPLAHRNKQIKKNNKQSNRIRDDEILNNQMDNSAI